MIEPFKYFAQRLIKKTLPHGKGLAQAKICQMMLVSGGIITQVERKAPLHGERLSTNNLITIKLISTMLHQKEVPLIMSNDLETIKRRVEGGEEEKKQKTKCYMFTWFLRNSTTWLLGYLDT